MYQFLAMPFLYRYSGASHCGHLHCVYQYKEHYHCIDEGCNFAVSIQAKLGSCFLS